MGFEPGTFGFSLQCLNSLSQSATIFRCVYFLRFRFKISDFIILCFPMVGWVGCMCVSGGGGRTEYAPMYVLCHIAMWSAAYPSVQPLNFNIHLPSTLIWWKTLSLVLSGFGLKWKFKYLLMSFEQIIIVSSNKYFISCTFIKSYIMAKSIF